MADNQKNFHIGNLADEMLKYTVMIVGKKEDKTPRFPRSLYDTYVNAILQDALSIHKDVFAANNKRSMTAKTKLVLDAIDNCEHMQHLIRISYDNGWISDKQRAAWAKHVHDLKYHIGQWEKKSKQ